MYIDVLLTYQDIDPGAVKKKNCVVIDTLRATSTIIAALAGGCPEIVPVGDAAEVFRLKKRGAFKDYLWGGEEEGHNLENFPLGNSPLEYIGGRLTDKGLIICTTNGTKALERTRFAENTVLCALLNLKTVARWLASRHSDTVICCAGTRGSYSMEDFFTAGRLIANLEKKGDRFLFSDLAATAAITAESIRKKYAGKNAANAALETLKNTENGKRLLAAGLERDLAYCAQEDIFSLLPVFENGSIKLRKIPPA